jgi:hypothetical protein
MGGFNVFSTYRDIISSTKFYGEINRQNEDKNYLAIKGFLSSLSRNNDGESTVNYIKTDSYYRNQGSIFIVYIIDYSKEELINYLTILDIQDGIESYNNKLVNITLYSNLNNSSTAMEIEVLQPPTSVNFGQEEVLSPDRSLNAAGFYVNYLFQSLIKGFIEFNSLTIKGKYNLYIAPKYNTNLLFYLPNFPQVTITEIPTLNYSDYNIDKVYVHGTEGTDYTTYINYFNTYALNTATAAYNIPK